ncbi:hypothetical protein ACFXGA_08745 [Actinosynnema sp. NPDC059335]|uniref:hypothetical protein n=1 Tax=Actinosynnema sp. NPDC059335 TaxID=3346804 RepID=UPI0036705619
MRTSRHGVRRAVAAVALALGAGLLAPPTATAQDNTGTCEGGRFSALPPDGTSVSRGQVIIYQVDIRVVDGDVLGCLRDVRLSPLLDFVVVRPDGYYSPEAQGGPTVSVVYDGPLSPGTYHGSVTMRVRADAPIGAVIEASSGPMIRHVVRDRPAT